VQFLRGSRTRVLQLASGPEKLVNPRVRSLELPPLWLRRHAGPVSAFESSSLQALAQLEGLGLVDAGSSVLDLGCGPGGFALALRPLLGAQGRYVGVDVHGPSVDWCCRAFKSEPRFSFHWLAARGSPYSEPSRLQPLRSIAGLGEFDLVLAKSLATHLLPIELARLLSASASCLSPRGSLVLTAFTFEPGAKDDVPLFPYHSPNGCVRWRLQAHRRAAIAYDLRFIRALLARCGLSETCFIPGFYPGTSRELSGQDTLVAKRVGDAAPQMR